MPLSRIAEAYVQVVPRIDGVASQLKSQLSGEMAAAGAVGGDAMAAGTARSFGSKIKGYVAPLAAGFAATFAAVGVANFFKEAVSGASDFNEQAAAVSQVFGKASGAIEQFASTGATSLGQTKVQILEAAKQFGIYGKAAGLAGQDNADFSTNLVQLATDLASFNNTSVDEAILAIGSGLRGEAEPLRRYGVLLDDATLRAQALKMGLIETTKEALSPQNKVLAANAVIMKQTETQQGDFARTSEGFANQQRILAAQFGNLSISVGQVLLPVLTQLASFANTVLIPAFTGIFNFIKDNKEVVGTFVAVLGGLLVIFNAVTIATKLWAAAQAVLNFVMGLNPFTLIAIALAALVAGIVYLATKTKFFQNVWKSMTQFARDAWDTVVKAFRFGWDMIIKFFTGALNFIVDLFLNWTVLGWIIKNWGGIVSFFSNALNNIVNFFKNALATIGSVVSNGIGNVIRFFRDMPNAVLRALGNAANWLVQVGKDMIQGLLNGAKSLLKNIGVFFLEMLPSWIVGPFKKALGIASPSKVFKEFGKNILQGLVKGLVEDAGSVQSQMKKVSDYISDSLDDKKLTKKAAIAARNLVKVYGARLTELNKEHDSIVKKLEKAQDDLADRLQQKLDFVQGLTSKFGAGYDINEEATAATAIQGLKDRIAKAKELKQVSDQLAELGLNKDLYKQIVEAGAVDFARSIIAGGASAVEELNVLGAEANQQASKLAEKVGGVLYDQGIAFAESVVKGLQQNESEISNVLKTVANEFANRLSAVIKSGLTGRTGEAGSQSGADAGADNPAGGADKKYATPAIISKFNSFVGQAGAINTAIANYRRQIAAAEKNKDPRARSAQLNTYGANLNKSLNSLNALREKARALFDNYDGLKWPTGVFAKGGFVKGPVNALIGEAGPEVVTPLKDFERMLGLDDSRGKTLNYYAAPNTSIDSERALFTAMKRAEVIAGW